MKPVLTIALLFSTLTVFAQDTTQTETSPIRWQYGPGKALMGELAEITLSEHQIFGNGDDARKFLVYNQNLTSGQEVGMVLDTVDGWWTVFEYSDIGYVKDDEKDDLDSTAMMEAMQENMEGANEARAEQGFPKMTILGWATAPNYNPVTNNLEYAIRGISEGSSVFINHTIKLLGRQGVMEVTLVTGPENYHQNLQPFRKSLDSFSFTSGNKYAEFREGDKIAEYGLTALVLGGAAALAVKSGFFNTILKALVAFWKLIAVGLVAAGSAVWKFLTGRKEKKKEEEKKSEPGQTPDETP
ncbi:MAG: DUF2167 domain-containing protein [Bacteroidetes bacterium]|nr:DUF2167 domain-containing protein [Bacteroidota bacterium]